jgi:N-acetylglucosaminyldiphosphoundecaprenol N-acetyl-beta-D-mannosaminyltransferase
MTPQTLIQQRSDVMGCGIDPLTMEETVARCVALIESRQEAPARQVSVNAAKLLEYEKNRQVKAYIDGSTIVSADGQSVVWASRLLGSALPQRVAGIDLMQRLVETAASRGWPTATSALRRRNELPRRFATPGPRSCSSR